MLKRVQAKDILPGDYLFMAGQFYRIVDVECDEGTILVYYKTVFSKIHSIKLAKVNCPVNFLVDRIGAE